MGDRRRIGLREVRALRPGETIWDSSVTGFGARRQVGVVAYVLKARTQEGRDSAGSPSADMGRLGRLMRPATKRADCSVRL